MISSKYKNKIFEKVLKYYKAEKFKKIISEFRLHSLFSEGELWGGNKKTT